MENGRHLTRRQVLAIAAAAAGTISLAEFTGIIRGSPAAATTSWRHPFDFRGGISPGQVYLGDAHKGLDYGFGGIGAGTPTYSIGPGIVEYVEIQPGNGAYGRFHLGTQVTVAHPNGWRSTYGHLQSDSVAVSNSQVIDISTLIGNVGNTGESYGNHLHIEMWATSNRATHFDPFDHIHWADLARPGVPLALPIVRRGMTTRFAKIGSGTGGLGTIVALAGDVGYPCPGNFQEYTRNPADGSPGDRAAHEYEVHGTVIWIPAAQWADLKKAYTEPWPTAGASPTVNLSADDRALLVNIADKLTPSP